MNIVLYTRDFEPITILNLPLWLLEKMEQQGGARIAVQDPDGQQLLADGVLPKESKEPKTVIIRCLRIRWLDGSTKTVLVTEDDELSLALKPDWLPGQRAQVNNYKQTINQLVYMLKKAMRPNE